jgi:hypothetical protein
MGVGLAAEAGWAEESEPESAVWSCLSRCFVI